jgi:hypothetical protein
MKWGYLKCVLSSVVVCVFLALGAWSFFRDREIEAVSAAFYVSHEGKVPSIDGTDCNIDEIAVLDGKYKGVWTVIAGYFTAEQVELCKAKGARIHCMAYYYVYFKDGRIEKMWPGRKIEGAESFEIAKKLAKAKGKGKKSKEDSGGK